MTTESTELARSFYDELDQLPAEIPGAATLEPGRISWLHGTNAAGAKAPGCFYAKDTAFTDPPGAPWVLDERYIDQEQPETGYSATELRIAILGERSQWFRPGQDRGDLPEWLPGYTDGAKKLTEYLIVVEGVADPMVLSVSGKYKAGPFARIVSTYRRSALAQAMRKVKRTLPLWSFWLPVAGQRDAAGKPIYTKAQDGEGKEYGSIVTPPALVGQPIPRTAADILDGAAIWESHGEWLKYKRLPQGTVEAAYTVHNGHPQLPPGKNVPRPIGEDEDF